MRLSYGRWRTVVQARNCAVYIAMELLGVSPRRYNTLLDNNGMFRGAFAEEICDAMIHAHVAPAGTERCL
jgi:hypothetical protein